MSDRKAIDIDDVAVFAALNAVPDAVLAHLKPESRVTADNIAAEAGRRIARRTGETAEGITVEETHNGEGYVVLLRGTRTHIGRFLEFSTQHMKARPFLFPSAKLEQGPAFRRALVAVQDAIDEQGLGE